MEIANGYLLPIVSGLCALLGGALSGAFTSYWARKGENLATKEDISDITKNTQEVLIEFDKERHRLRVEADLRTVVLDKRFQAHQEAYKHAATFRLIRSMSDGVEKTKKINEISEWWFEKNLYLEPQVRVAFTQGLSAADAHRGLLEEATLARDTGSTDLAERMTAVEDNGEKIRRLTGIIENAVELSPIVLPASLDPSAEVRMN